jgi:hypothetical protein
MTVLDIVFLGIDTDLQKLQKIHFAYTMLLNFVSCFRSMFFLQVNCFDKSMKYWNCVNTCLMSSLCLVL